MNLNWYLNSFFLDIHSFFYTIKHNKKKLKTIQERKASKKACKLGNIKYEKDLFILNLFNIKIFLHTWEEINLDVLFAKLILPFLQKFYEKHSGYPAYMTNEEYEIKLKQSILAFNLLINSKDAFNERESQQIKEGLKVFAEIFQTLWY